MFKNMQFKIILIFFIIGIVVISGLGITYLNSVNKIQTQIENGDISQIEQIDNELEIMQKNNVTALIIAGVTFTVGGILIAIFLSRFVIYPIDKLIKSAEKIASGENVNVKETSQNTGEVADMENAFSIVTNELNQKLPSIQG